MSPTRIDPGTLVKLVFGSSMSQSIAAIISMMLVRRFVVNFGSSTLKAAKITEVSGVARPDIHRRCKRVQGAEMGDLGIDAVGGVSSSSISGSLAAAWNDPPQSSVEAWTGAMATASNNRSAAEQSQPNAAKSVSGGATDAAIVGTPSPIPPNMNSIVCQRGELVVQNNNSGPDRSCTQTHESSHLADWKARYGNNLCASVPDGRLPVGGSGYDEFLRQLECKAYKVGKECREQLLSKATDADKPRHPTGY
jgi:hypothetical protein